MVAGVRMQAYGMFGSEGLFLVPGANKKDYLVKSFSSPLRKSPSYLITQGLKETFSSLIPITQHPVRLRYHIPHPIPAYQQKTMHTAIFNVMWPLESFGRLTQQLNFFLRVTT